MDLGIAGRTAIVCASSRGLGRACAEALAYAGCHVIVNGRTRDVVDATVTDLHAKTGATVTGVVADVGERAGQDALLRACPEPDILVNNNSGPPLKDFRTLTREQMLDGVVANMVTAIELTQRVIDPMVRRRFGRIVNITSGTVKMPLAGLDLSSGARAGLTAFLAGVARTVVSANVTINFILPGAFETDRLRSTIQVAAATQASSTTRPWRNGFTRFPRSDLAIRRNLAPSARSCAPRTRVSSPGKACSSTEERTRGHSESRLDRESAVRHLK
jgi:3-oxoacyl-[acyl-carrier protein] reductase